MSWKKIAVGLVLFLSFSNLFADDYAVLAGAVKVGDIKAVQTLLDKGISANITNEFGTPVTVFCLDIDDIRMLKFLISKGADYTLKNSIGRTLLMFSYSFGDEAIFEYLTNLEDIRIRNSSISNFYADLKNQNSEAVYSCFADHITVFEYSETSDHYSPGAKTTNISLADYQSSKTLENLFLSNQTAYFSMENQLFEKIKSGIQPDKYLSLVVNFASKNQEEKDKNRIAFILIPDAAGWKVQYIIRFLYDPR